MDLLTKPVETFTYDDIVKFCQAKEPEGVWLDYKEQYPKVGLKTHIAALTNKLGGVIVIGIKEDDVSGIPVTWEGVGDGAKLLERAYQDAANILPYPSIKAHVTNQGPNGQAFVLVRVFEGTKPPYYCGDEGHDPLCEKVTFKRLQA